MPFDIRLPIGLFFSSIGLLLAGFGVVAEKQIYQRSLGINVNLAWGAVLLICGVIMIGMGRRSRRISIDSGNPSGETPRNTG